MSFRRLSLKNTSGETAPAFGIAEVADALPVPEGGATTDGASVLEIRKPTGAGRVVAIAPAAIEDDRYGKGFTGDAFVRFTGSDPSPGDVLYATSGSWAVSSGGTGTGVTVAGDVRDMGGYKIVRVEIGGGSGGGSSLTPVFVYSDLEGGTRDTEGAFTPGADVRYLPAILDGATFVPDLEAEFGTGKVWSLASLSMDATGCGCDDADGPVPTGVLIDSGLGADGNDRVYDSDDDSGFVTITGTGVAPDATITVTIYDGTNTLTPAVTNNGDGTWEAAPADLTDDPFIKGVVRVTATDGATTDVRVITYSGNDSPTELGFFTGRAPRPDMTAATDLGASDTDNTTSDRTPTFSCAHGGTAPVDAGGPTPRLYVKGVLVASGSISSYSTTIPVVSSVDLTPGSDLAYGYQNAQLVLEWTDTVDDYWGPPSLNLRINIDEDATEETEPAKRYGRLGWVTSALGVNWVTVDKCRFERTEAENTKLDA